MHFKTLTLMFTILIASTSYSKECEVNGKAILWAYDACLWQYETDDTLHPGVIECVNISEKTIKTVGTCEAKKIFKRKICDLAIKYSEEYINQEACMNEDKALGPSVRENGI